MKFRHDLMSASLVAINPFICYMAAEEADETANIVIDGETTTLADLMGINMDEIAELRGEALPKGVYTFEVDTDTPPHVTVIGEGKDAKAAAVINAKVLEVQMVDDPDFTGDTNTLIGKRHRETFFLTAIESLGYLKAFLKDIGAPYNPNLKTMLFNAAGTRFQAPIQKKKDKNDADKVYTNFNRSKLKPLSPAPTQQGNAAA